MNVEHDISDLKRRIALLEEDAKGEKLVTRHILRKVTENETILLDVKKEVTDLRSDVALLRADLPGIIANVVGALLRDHLRKQLFPSCSIGPAISCLFTENGVDIASAVKNIDNVKGAAGVAKENHIVPIGIAS